MRIFDDRFVVESPGGFVPPTTSETVYDGHNPRNPFLVEAMMHLEFTFNSFEGTRRMRSVMQGANLPAPRFRQIESLNHQVHVVLENDIASVRSAPKDRASFVVAPDLMLGLSTDERLILAVLTRSVSVNITSAALACNKSWPTAQRIVSGLVERGLLIPVETQRKKHDSTKSYTVPGREVGGSA